MTMTDDLRRAAASPDPDAPTLSTAQLVWLRAADLGPDPDAAAALDLVRLARSEPSVLEHAIALGRARAGAPEPDALAAVAALETALALVAGRDRLDGP